MTEEYRYLDTSKLSTFYCEVDKCNVVQRLKQENENEKKAYNECMYYLNCMTEQRNKLKLALEEIRELIKDYPYIEIQAVEKIRDKIDEVLGND